MKSNESSIKQTSNQELDPTSEDFPANENSAADVVTPPDDWEPLPLDPNYTTPGACMYRYRGTIVGNIHLTWGMIEQLEQFRGRPSDVIVASYPKSGTTWLQEIVWRVTHCNEITSGRGSGVPLEFRFPMLELKSQKDLMEMASLEDLPEPRFIKTHLHYHMLPRNVFSSGAKVLYVSRDARDVCVSSYHLARILVLQMYRGTFTEFRESFMQNKVVYGPYREHVKGYLDHSDTVLCLTYEQMHQDRASVVRKVADFLGVSLSEEDVFNVVKLTSFEVMKENPDTNFRHWEKSGMIPKPEGGAFMRKGIVGDWRDHFTEEESEAFMKWRNEEVLTLCIDES